MKIHNLFLSLEPFSSLAWLALGNYLWLPLLKPSTRHILSNVSLFVTDFLGSRAEFMAGGNGVQSFPGFGVDVGSDNFADIDEMVTGGHLGFECAFEVCNGVC